MSRIVEDDSHLQPQSSALKLALEVVEALKHDGFVTIPVRPTMAMLSAGSRAAGITTDQTMAVYKAMLTAAE